jgi:hypothetical protein
MMLLFIILTAALTWQFVLKASVYPQSIPIRIKIIHAFILFFTALDAWSGLRQFVWLLFRPNALDWSRPFLMAGLFCWGMSGTCLLFFCYGMARRRKNIVNWFLLFWMLTFFSGLIVTGIRFNAIFDSASTIQVVVTFTGFFIFTLAFYLCRRNKLFFDDVKSEPTAP